MRLRTNRAPRPGAVLLAVLVIVVILSLAAYQFSESMLAEFKAAESHRRSAQARALADSGLHYTAALLASADSIQSNLNGNPWSNASMFQGVSVGESEFPKFQGHFSVIAATDDADATGTNQAFRYGVIDETGKLNINALVKIDSSPGGVAEDRLMALPGMSADIVNSILDWMDEDEEPRSNGGENEYYLTLAQPYRVKNGPLESIQELLLVKGVTPQLLFGNDHNRNGVLDPEEDDGSGTLDRGLSGYLTVYSREMNVDSTGQLRIWINDTNLETLKTKLTNAALDQKLIDFIIAYRTYGPYEEQTTSGTTTTSQSSQGSQGTTKQGTQNQGTTNTTPIPASTSNQPISATNSGNTSSGGNSRNSSRSGGSTGGSGSGGGSGGGTGGSSGGGERIGSLFDLIGVKVQIPAEKQGDPPTILESPLNDLSGQQQLLPVLLDKTSTENRAELEARVNVNTASKAVLAALPGLDEADVQNLMAKRPSLSASEAPGEAYLTPAWLITEANLSKDKVKTLERYITARSQAFRVQVVGYFAGGGPSARIEAVIDTSGGKPRIAFWRDLTGLGRGFDPNSQE